MHRFLVLSFYLYGLCALAAQERVDYDYVFEHLSTDDGLSHGSVSAMIKDSRGYMWFATWDGLNRYDGYEFVSYKPGNPINSASNRIESLLEDRFGNLWVGTNDAKMFRFNRGHEAFEQFPQSSEKEVHLFFMSSKGDAWLSSSAGLYQIVTDSLNHATQQRFYGINGAFNLQDNRVRFLAEDGAGNIWINTDKGIVCMAEQPDGSYGPKTLSISVNERLNRDQLTSWAALGDHIVFGTLAGDLLIYNPGSTELREWSTGFPSPITHLSQDNAGNLFVSTQGNGVWMVDGQKWTSVRHFYQEDMGKVLKTYPDSNGRLWVETMQAGVLKFDIKTGLARYYRQTLAVPEDLRPHPQMGIMEDADQTVWLTLKGGGFGYYDAATDEVAYFKNQPDSPDSKVSNFVNCFYKDPSGVLWMSTYFKGLEKVTFIKRKFTYTRPVAETNLSIANEVRALLYDSQGLLWVATKKGEIFILNDQNELVHKITSLNGREPGRVYALMEDSRGQIFLGTRGNGLFVLTRKKGMAFDVVHYASAADEVYALSDNNIYALLEDHQGRIWVGTYGGGLNLMQEGRFIHAGNDLEDYPKNTGLRVRHIAEDAQGRLWVGTTEGLILGEVGPSNQMKFLSVNSENGCSRGLLSNDVFWILCDAQQQVWLATLGGGLSKWESGDGLQEPLIFKTYTKEHGLSSEVVFTMVDDASGRLWLSSENGISSFDPESAVFKNYGRYDGIVNPGFSEGAVAQRADGMIGFGAINGLYSFQPSTFKEEGLMVAIEFTGFSLLGKELAPDKGSVLQQSISATSHLQFKYHQNGFGLSWAAMDFVWQDKVQYGCQLQGYDEEWRSLGAMNRVDYTRLPPGKYVFKVRVDNPELKALSGERSLHIEILPPPWKTWWAYLSYTVLAVVLLVFTRRTVSTILHLRNKVLVEKELADAKLNFFTHVSHELRTPLTLILGPAKELRETENLSEKGRTYARLIEQNGVQLLRQVNQLLDFRKVQKEKMDLHLTEVNLVPFINTVCHNFEDLAQRKHIQFTVVSEVPFAYASVDADKMESVLYNLLANAFKFTPAGGKVEVLLAHPPNGHEIVLEVRDNGSGISKEQEKRLFELFASHYNQAGLAQAGTGIGLVLAQELVVLQGGSLIYRPTPGGGATFHIHLKAVAPNNGHKPFEVPDTLLSVSATRAEAVDETNAGSPHLPSLLIVEDNKDLRTFLRLQLQDYYTLTEAENGRQGWEMAQALGPDMIISDIMMPEMSGIELLDRLKHHFDTSHIPVVLLTAKSSVESQVEGLKFGADAYITKPFYRVHLKAQLSALLHQRQLLREKFAGPKGRQTEADLGLLTEKDLQFLDRVRSVIEAHLTDSDFRMEILYSALGMGRSKFFAKLKGLTGLSPIDYVKAYRLNKALSLLESGRYNVSETSFLSGFSDSGYFSKCFKEKFGINPSEVSTQ